VAFGSVTPSASVLSAARALAPRWLLDVMRSSANSRHGLRLCGDLERASTAAQLHNEPGTPLSRRLWQDVSRESLPALLRYEDRNSMRFGIEARVPFLDFRLVELSLSLPDRLRICGGMTKVVLRRAMAGRLPVEILDRRDKVGFAAPQNVWMSGAQDEIRRFLLPDSQVIRRGWVRPEDVRQVLADSSRGGRAQQLAWRMWILEAWLQEYWPTMWQPPAAHQASVRQ
jgi:asparagine synthase (glutamine-hydrolysing)